LLRIRSRISRHLALNSLALTVRLPRISLPTGHLRCLEINGHALLSRCVRLLRYDARGIASMWS
jgi:hypothetical protein